LNNEKHTCHLSLLEIWFFDRHLYAARTYVGGFLHVVILALIANCLWGVFGLFVVAFYVEGTDLESPDANCR
jgi:hypothetical protein